MKNRIEMTVLDKIDDCCGCKICGAVCKKQAIKFQTNEEGFWYPVIDLELCVDCGMCRALCPINNTNVETRLIETYGAKNEDRTIVNKSSSGGIFYSLAKTIIEKSGIVYAVGYNKENIAVFMRASKISELTPMFGSKYVQADPGNVYNDLLKDIKENKDILFVGTPCQVAGVRNIVGQYPKLILVDIICHGTPSPKLFEEYIHYLEQKRKKKIIGYENRSKVLGWKHTEKIYFSDGSVEYKSVLSQAWRNIFYSNCAMRTSCEKCKFNNHTINRMADITIADFWGVENYHKEFFSPEGVSFVGIYTDKGKCFFNEVRPQLSTIPVDISEVLPRQPHFRGVSVSPEKKREFWQEYQEKGISGLIKKYGRYNAKEIIRSTIKGSKLYRIMKRR